MHKQTNIFKLFSATVWALEKYQESPFGIIYPPDVKLHKLWAAWIMCVCTWDTCMSLSSTRGGSSLSMGSRAAGLMLAAWWVTSEVRHASVPSFKARWFFRKKDPRTDNVSGRMDDKSIWRRRAVISMLFKKSNKKGAVYKKRSYWTLNGEAETRVMVLTAVSLVISFFNLSRKIAKTPCSSAPRWSPRWHTMCPMQEIALSFTSWSMSVALSLFIVAENTLGGNNILWRTGDKIKHIWAQTMAEPRKISEETKTGTNYRLNTT